MTVDDCSYSTRRGNNKIGSLKILVEDPRIARLFFVPGANETCRFRSNSIRHATNVLFLQPPPMGVAGWGQQNREWTAP